MRIAQDCSGCHHCSAYTCLHRSAVTSNSASLVFQGPSSGDVRLSRDRSLVRLVAGTGYWMWWWCGLWLALSTGLKASSHMLQLVCGQTPLRCEVLEYHLGGQLDCFGWIGCNRQAVGVVASSAGCWGPQYCCGLQYLWSPQTFLELVLLLVSTMLLDYNGKGCPNVVLFHSVNDEWSPQWSWTSLCQCSPKCYWSTLYIGLQKFVAIAYSWA